MDTNLPLNENPYIQSIELDDAVELALERAIGIQRLELITITDDDRETLRLAQTAIISPRVVQYDEVSLEGTSVLELVWKAVAYLIREAWEAFVRWWRRTVDISGRIAKGAKTLAKRAWDTEGLPTNKQILVRSAQYLYTDDKPIGLTPTGIQAVANYTRFNFPVKSLDETARLFVQGITSREILDDRDADLFIADMEKRIQTYNARLMEGAAAVHLPGEDMIYRKAIPDFPGAPYILFRQSGPKSPAQMAFLRPNTAETYRETLHPALSTSDIADYCNSLHALAEIIVKSNRTEREVTKLHKDIEKAGDRLVKLVRGSLTQGRFDSLSQTLRQIKIIGTNARYPIRETHQMAVQVLTAGYNFAIDAYKNIDVKHYATPKGK